MSENIPGLDHYIEERGRVIRDFEAEDEERLRRMEEREERAREAAGEREERPWTSAQGMRELKEKWDAEEAERAALADVAADEEREG